MQRNRLVGLLAGALFVFQSSCVPDSVRNLFSSKEKSQTVQVPAGNGGRPAIVILDRGISRTNQTYAADLYAVGKELGVFVTQVTDPVPMPVTIWDGEGTSWKEAGKLDVPGISSESTGWIFSRPGAAPRYQPPGPRDEMIGAASAYFGMDLASALPWRAVIAIAGLTDDRFDRQVEELHRLLDPRSIYVLSWKPGDPTPVSFPQGSTPVGSVDPSQVTAESNGWILAEKGKDAQYIAAQALPELMRSASTYFGMDFQTSRTGALGKLAKAGGRMNGGGQRTARTPATMGGRGVRGPRNRQGAGAAQEK
jgi:hypothetical protein